MDGVVARVKEIAALDSEGRKAYMASAKDVSTIALWENQIQYYKEAYSKAIEKVIEAKGAFPDELNEDKSMVYKKIVINNPTWKSVMVTRHLPDALSGLETLSKTFGGAGTSPRNPCSNRSIRSSGTTPATIPWLCLTL